MYNLLFIGSLWVSHLTCAKPLMMTPKWNIFVNKCQRLWNGDPYTRQHL